MVSKFIHHIYFNIRQEGKMSTQSKTRLKNMTKKYIKDITQDFDFEQATSGRSPRIGL